MGHLGWAIILFFQIICKFTDIQYYWVIWLRTCMSGEAVGYLGLHRVSCYVPIRFAIKVFSDGYCTIDFVSLPIIANYYFLLDHLFCWIRFSGSKMPTIKRRNSMLWMKKKKQKMNQILIEGLLEYFPIRTSVFH